MTKSLRDHLLDNMENDTTLHRAAVIEFLSSVYEYLAVNYRNYPSDDITSTYIIYKVLQEKIK